MKASLKYRLLMLAAMVLVVTLAVAALGVTQLFQSHFERRIGQELDTHLSQLAGNLRFGADGALELVREPADPRFQRPYGGLYWQVLDETGNKEIRSRSLWDERLATPADKIAPGQKHVHDVAGPADTDLLLHEQLFVVPGDGGDHLVRASVAVDRNELNEVAASFRNDMAIAMLVLGAVLMAGFAFQVLAGLRPMQVLSTGLGNIRSGSWRRFEGEVPDEIRPLVAELNEMLARKEEEMVKAKDRAADLAHGLKTPLTALAADIRRLKQRGEEAIASDIESLAEQMHAHVERELIRARVRHRSERPLEIEPAINAMIRTLKKLPAARDKAMKIRVEPGLAMKIGRDDFNEILGNLTENALRHASNRVVISAGQTGEGIELVVEDDGRGIEEDKLQMMQGRGVRQDEMAGSAGLGLAIVKDIVFEIGGMLSLERSSLGGLLARVRIPGEGAPSTGPAGDNIA